MQLLMFVQATCQRLSKQNLRVKHTTVLRRSYNVHNVSKHILRKAKGLPQLQVPCKFSIHFSRKEAVIIKITNLLSFKSFKKEIFHKHSIKHVLP